MKKAISTLLALILAISLLSSFGIAAAEEAQTEDIIHLEPLSVPESYKQNCSEMGSLEMISYTVTSEKDTDKTTEKTAYVYTPYGYDPAQPYDILYLVHGGGGNEREWLVHTKLIIDNMIQLNEAEPAIIVTPTFYYPDGFCEEADGQSDTSIAQFAVELRDALIPAVEAQYATYANGDVRKENLVATRAHRGIAGLSMGSMHILNCALMENLDLFSWYGSFSGAFTPAAADISTALHSEAFEPYDIDYLFVTNGTADFTYETHIPVMQELEQIDSKLTNGDNFSISVFEDAAHDWEDWEMSLYRFLPIVFRGAQKATPEDSEAEAADIVKYEPLSVPESYKESCSEMGSLAMFSYTVTSEKDADVTTEKTAYIYTPYGYDAANRYDILYLLHGGGGNEREWLVHTKLIIDNMIQLGEANSMIIVTPTLYYPDGFCDEADGKSDTSITQFASELRNALIPAVEAQYSSFAGGDVSEGNLIATREHRGIAGLSMGSMHILNCALMRNLDLFSWYGSFSGAGATAADISAALHSEAFEPYGIDYLFVANGTADFSYEGHIALMKELEQIEDKLTDGENFSISVFEDAAHDWPNWEMALYRFLPIVFRGRRDATPENSEAEAADIVKYEPLSVPESYLQNSSEMGSIATISYTVVSEQDANVTAEKTAYVYTPYGYDAAQQYDILYLVHGGGGNEREWLSHTKPIIDHMIQEGEANPIIIVTPTFYYPDGFCSEPDGRQDDSYSQFAAELRDALIPAVETQYATYAGGDVSEENLIATREHRGLGGLSMGSMHTINSGLMRNLDLFAWYASLSGAKTAAADISAAMHSEALASYDISYLFVSNGTVDMSCEEHIGTMKELERIDDKLTNGENFSIVVFEEADHDWNNWQMALYRMLPKMFRK